MDASREIFSFHLVELPLLRVPQFFMKPIKIKGLLHAERLLTMNLGAPVTTLSRYNFNRVALFAWWNEESSLDKFLALPSQSSFQSDGWHVRMKLYRKWGHITELNDAFIDPEVAIQNGPVVAVTLARLNLLQTARFIKWGKPVERQVRDHQGQTLALASIRPFNTFNTFSVWKNEAAMISMVHGQNRVLDGESHKLAMLERARKDFHHEFTTMRFTPLIETGTWNGKANYIFSAGTAG